jgi:hypothetical protein
VLVAALPHAATVAAIMCHDDQVVRGGVAALVGGLEDDARPVEELVGPTE